MKPGSRIAMLFLAVVAAAHLLRVIYGLEVRVADLAIPVWASGVAALFTGALSLLLWREARS